MRYDTVTRPCNCIVLSQAERDAHNVGSVWLNHHSRIVTGEKQLLLSLHCCRGKQCYRQYPKDRFRCCGTIDSLAIALDIVPQ